MNSCNLRLLLLAGAILTGSAHADEIGWTGTLGLNLGQGEIRNSQNDLLDREYREAILDTDLSWKQFRLNTALAWQSPSEFPDTRTIDSTLIRKASLLRASLEWQGPVLLRAGTISTTFGRGMSLSLYRDEQLQNPLLDKIEREDTPTTWDSSVQGGYLEYLGETVALKAVAGHSDYYGNLLGINPEFTRDRTTLGLAWNTVDDVVIDAETDALNQDVENRELYLSQYLGNWDFFVSHLEQVVPAGEARVAGKGGVATYAAVGTQLLDWSVRAEYKYYRLTSEKLRFNNPPIVQQEIPSRLIARKRKRFNHFDDEVGFQLELQRLFRNEMEVFFSAAQTSRMDPESSSATLLPELKEVRDAYQEYTANWQWTLPSANHVMLGLVWAEESEARVDAPSILYRNMGLSGSLYTPLPLVRGLELNAEYLSREAVYDKHTQDLALLWMDIFPLPDLSFNLTADFEHHSDTNEDWMGSTEARYDFATPGDLHHSLTVFAGRLRGGLVCSSGNCRIVAPFRGAKLQYTLQF